MYKFFWEVFLLSAAVDQKKKNKLIFKLVLWIVAIISLVVVASMNYTEQKAIDIIYKGEGTLDSVQAVINSLIPEKDAKVVKTFKTRAKDAEYVINNIVDRKLISEIRVDETLAEGFSVTVIKFNEKSSDILLKIKDTLVKNSNVYGVVATKKMYSFNYNSFFSIILLIVIVAGIFTRNWLVSILSSLVRGTAVFGIMGDVVMLWVTLSLLVIFIYGIYTFFFDTKKFLKIKRK